MNKMAVFIDADSMIFRAGCSVEESFYVVLDENGFVKGEYRYKRDIPEEYLTDEYILDRYKRFTDNNHEDDCLYHAQGRLNDMLNNIVKREWCGEYQVFLGGSGNFRKEVNPEYKAHRDDFMRPMLEQRLRDYLINKWDAEVVDGEEADDRVSYLHMEQYSKDADSSCIAYIDKDLENTPGWHWNFLKEEMTFISEEEAIVNFYRQLLTGDQHDLVGSGVKGIGVKKAAKIIPHAAPPLEMYRDVLSVYEEHGMDEGTLINTAQCLWIRQKENELWTPPLPYNS